MEPLISISASTLAQLLASHSVFVLAEHKRNPAYDTSHPAYKADTAVIEELMASLGEFEFMRLMERVMKWMA